MAEQTQPQEPDETRTEVRAGLVMVKRRILKEDGRYLYYYDFERTAADDAKGAGDGA